MQVHYRLLTPYSINSGSMRPDLTKGEVRMIHTYMQAVMPKVHTEIHSATCM